MAIKGMTEKEQAIVEKILLPYKEKPEFYYYGSRVKDNFSKLSDLDILSRNNLSYDEISLIKYQFDESIELPFIVNIAFKTSMGDYFYNLIKDDLVKIDF